MSMCADVDLYPRRYVLTSTRTYVDKGALMRDAYLMRDTYLMRDAYPMRDADPAVPPCRLMHLHQRTDHWHHLMKPPPYRGLQSCWGDLSALVANTATFLIWALVSQRRALASYLLPPTSYLLPPASCLLPPATCQRALVRQMSSHR